MIFYLGLGSNMGDRENFLASARDALDTHPQIQVLRSSAIITTEPYGVTDQPDFLNCVLEISTQLSAEELLDFCLQTELELGRVRTIKWGPRTIDIDILLGPDVIQKDRLTIPHPELHKREFVLCSLVELCPEYLHPIEKITINKIYKNLINN